MNRKALLILLAALALLALGYALLPSSRPGPGVLAARRLEPGAPLFAAYLFSARLPLGNEAAGPEVPPAWQTEFAAHGHALTPAASLARPRPDRWEVSDGAGRYLVEPGEDGVEVSRLTFTPGDVQTVRLQQGDVGIVLKRSGSDWTVASHHGRRAGRERVTELLDALADTGLVEKRLGGNACFELEGSARTDVELLGARDAVLLKLALGKTSDWNRCFAQVQGLDDTLELDQDLNAKSGHRTQPGAAGQPDRRALFVDYWYDLHILSFRPDAVLDFTIRQGNQSWRVQKVIPGKGPLAPRPPGGPAIALDPKDPRPVWRITEPEEADADEGACRAVCATAGFLDGKAYADDVPPVERGLTPPAFQTTLVLEDATRYVLSFGKLLPDGVLLQREGRDDVWKIERFNFEGLTRSLERLKRAASAPPPLKTGEGLVLPP